MPGQESNLEPAGSEPAAPPIELPGIADWRGLAIQPAGANLGGMSRVHHAPARALFSVLQKPMTAEARVFALRRNLDRHPAVNILGRYPQPTPDLVSTGSVFQTIAQLVPVSPAQRVIEPGQLDLV